MCTRKDKAVDMKQKIFIVMFTFTIILFVGFNVWANGNSNGIYEEESKINENQEKLDEIQSLLSSLNSSKNELDEYLMNLNSSYEAIASYITKLEGEMTELQKQIGEINDELETAQKQQADQYEAMKLRIQYMYETGDDSYISAVFSDSSISEILNKVEYTAELIKYDREKLEEYEQLLTYVAAVKIELEKENSRLEEIAKEQKKQQQQIQVIMSEAAVNIKNKETEIDQAESKAQELAREIQNSKDSIEELKAEESRRLEESIKQEQNGNQDIYEEGTSAPYYDASYDEVMMLAAILYCEARGEPYQGILAVGTVVMNRVADPRFPNTIEGVILSPGQFSPVASGLYAIALAKGANETCIQAAREVLYNGVRIGPWVYFRTVNNIIQGTVIGHHVFYYR